MNFDTALNLALVISKEKATFTIPLPPSFVPHSAEYLLHRTSGPVLEVLLLVLHQSHPTLCHRLCQAILKRSKVMTASPPQTPKRYIVVRESLVSPCQHECLPLQVHMCVPLVSQGKGCYHGLCASCNHT